MKDSKIGWTHHTFNPWWGCQKIAPECANCYADAFAKRVGKTGLWGPGRTFRTFGDAHWAEPLKWNEAAKAAGERHRVFCASMADVFDADAPDELRERLVNLIDSTPHLDWLLLSKRLSSIPPGVNFPSNVWLGGTCGHSKSLPNIEALGGQSAAIRFVSAEPLLEDLMDHLDYKGYDLLETEFCGIDWVIIGGESGAGARPFDLAWARALIEHCRDVGAAVFVKQLGARPMIDGAPLKLKDRKGEDWSEWPEDLRIREFPEVRR